MCYQNCIFEHYYSGDCGKPAGVPYPCEKEEDVDKLESRTELLSKSDAGNRIWASITDLISQDAADRIEKLHKEDFKILGID